MWVLARAPIKRRIGFCGSKHRTGATVSMFMASTRYGSAGELLAWRPDHVGHEALYGCDTRGRTGPLARERSVHVQ